MRSQASLPLASIDIRMRIIMNKYQDYPCSTRCAPVRDCVVAKSDGGTSGCCATRIVLD